MSAKLRPMARTLTTTSLSDMGGTVVLRHSSEEMPLSADASHDWHCTGGAGAGADDASIEGRRMCGLYTALSAKRARPHEKRASHPPELASLYKPDSVGSWRHASCGTVRLGEGG